jgi:hypothetical protein
MEEQQQPRQLDYCPPIRWSKSSIPFEWVSLALGFFGIWTDIMPNIGIPKLFLFSLLPSSGIMAGIIGLRGHLRVVCCIGILLNAVWLLSILSLAM